MSSKWVDNFYKKRSISGSLFDFALILHKIILGMKGCGNAGCPLKTIFELCPGYCFSVS